MFNLHTWLLGQDCSRQCPKPSASMQGGDRDGDMHAAAETPKVTLHASFEAARALVGADASYTGQFALAALRVLQHGIIGMNICLVCADVEQPRGGSQAHILEFYMIAQKYCSVWQYSHMLKVPACTGDMTCDFLTDCRRALSAVGNLVK